MTWRRTSRDTAHPRADSRLVPRQDPLAPTVRSHLRPNSPQSTARSGSQTLGARQAGFLVCAVSAFSQGIRARFARTCPTERPGPRAPIAEKRRLPHAQILRKSSASSAHRVGSHVRSVVQLRCCRQTGSILVETLQSLSGRLNSFLGTLSFSKTTNNSRLGIDGN